MPIATQQIIEQTKQVFMRYGIRSVSMDEVAKQLRISKKTLYQHVKDKGDLVNRVMTLMSADHQSCICAIQEEPGNAIDESYRITEYVANMLQDIHPSIHFDLEKYHPEAWNKLQQVEQRTIYECMSKNLLQGVEEGLYRDDLNIPIVVKVYLSRFDVCFDGELFPPSEYSFSEVQWEIFRYHTRGIASAKGLKYLEKKVERELEE